MAKPAKRLRAGKVQLDLQRSKGFLISLGFLMFFCFVFSWCFLGDVS